MATRGLGAVPLALALLGLLLAVLAPVAEAFCYGIKVLPLPMTVKYDQRYQITSSNTRLRIPFNFEHSPTTGGSCNDLKRRYAVTVNGALMNPAWISLSYLGNNEQPYIDVQTTDANLANIYTVVVTGSVNTNPVTYSDEPLTFTVTLSTHQCVLTRIVDPGIDTIYFHIKSQEPATVYTYDPFTFEPAYSCGGLLFDVPLEAGETHPECLKSHVSSSRTFTVETKESTQVGTHYITFTAQQADWPRWNPVTTVYKEVEIVITAECELTTFYFTRLEVSHFVDPASTTSAVTFIEPPDRVSLEATGDDLDANGVQYCQDRTYTMAPGIVGSDTIYSLNGPTQTITVTASSQAHYGEYSPTISITLDAYAGFPAEEHQIDIKIVPSCSQAFTARSAFTPPGTTNSNALNYDAPTLIDMVTVVDGEAVTQSVGLLTYELSDHYNSYCGSISYSLVGGDTAYLTFDPDTMELTFQALLAEIDPNDIGANKNHAIRVTLDHVDFPNTYHDIPFTTKISNCPTTFLTDKSTMASSMTYMTQTDPLYYVINEAGATRLELPFTFSLTDADNTACGSEITWSYSYHVNSTDDQTASWATIEYIGGDYKRPQLVIESADPLDTGLQTVRIWAVVVNSDPVIRSDQFDTEVVIDVNIKMYNSPCLDGQITAPVIPDMTLSMSAPFVPATQTMLTWDHDQSGIDSCANRDYVLSGDAFDRGILTLNPDTRVITLATSNSFDVGTYSVTVTTNIAGHDFLVPELEVSTSFSVTVESPCKDTEFRPNPTLGNKMTFVGEEAVVWVFDEWPDTISQSLAAYLPTSSPFCEDRMHRIESIVSATGDPDYVITSDPAVVELNDEYMFFELNAPDSSYEGVHRVNIEVELHNYVRDNYGPYYQSFDVYVVPSCNSTAFSTNQAQVKNLYDIGLYSGPYIQSVPSYTLSTEEAAKKYAVESGNPSLYQEGHCGAIVQTLEMVDGSSVPSFIKLLEPEGVGMPHKVYVYANEDSQIGSYELQIVTTLGSRYFQTGLVPVIEYFNVTVVEYPHTERNFLAYPIQTLPDVLSLPINGVATIPLAPEDPDGDDTAVITEFKVLSSLSKNECSECFVWNERALVFTFYAKEKLAGMTSRFRVDYTDSNLEVSTYFFSIEVDKIEEAEIEAGEEEGGQGQGGSDSTGESDQGTEDNQPLPDQPNKPTEALPQAEVIFESPEQVYLHQWQEFNNLGYLLSGQVFVTHEEEAEALQEIPFPVPYVKSFDAYGFIEIGFNHKMEDQNTPLKDLVDAGLLQIELVNDSSEITVGGQPNQPEYLRLEDFSGGAQQQQQQSQDTQFDFLNMGSSLRHLQQAEGEGEEVIEDTTAPSYGETLSDYELEAAKLKEFKWRIESLDADSMRLRLDWSQPSQISFMDQDRIELKFAPVEGATLLKCAYQDSICAKNQINYPGTYEYKLRTYVPKQLARSFQSTENEDRLERFLGLVKYLTFLAFMVMCGLALFLSSQPLLFFWNYISYLQMLVHVGLISAPLTAQIQHMLAKLFPWVSLTQIETFTFFFDDLDYSVAPPYSSNYWELGYRTKNAALNARTLCTFVFLPLCLTLLYFLFKCLKRFKWCGCFERRFFKKESLHAIWIRGLLVVFFPAGMITFQSILANPEYRNFTLAQASEGERHLTNGDYLSQIFSFYTFIIVLGVALLGGLTLACKHSRYAAVYRTERLAVYANSLVFFYKATKEEKLERERRKMEKDRDKRLQSLHEVAIRDTIASALDRRNAESQMYMTRKGPLDVTIDTEKTESDLIEEAWKLRRIRQLQNMSDQHVILSRQLSFWHQGWSDEYRKGLKPFSVLSLSYCVIQVMRQAVFMAILLLPPESSQLQLNLATFLSAFMLGYLAVSVPHTSKLLNFMEFANEGCLYLVLLTLMALNIFSAQISGSRLEDYGWLIILIVCLSLALNLAVMIYSLCQPFKESLNDRDSERLGRCLRYFCRVSLPENNKCFCDCCTCGDEAKDVQSDYPKRFFFNIQPLSCVHCETSEAVDGAESDEENASQLLISDGEEAEAEAKSSDHVSKGSTDSQLGKPEGSVSDKDPARKDKYAVEDDEFSIQGSVVSGESLFGTVEGSQKNEKVKRSTLQGNSGLLGHRDGQADFGDGTKQDFMKVQQPLIRTQDDFAPKIKFSNLMPPMQTIKTNSSSNSIPPQMVTLASLEHDLEGITQQPKNQSQNGFFAQKDTGLSRNPNLGRVPETDPLELLGKLGTQPLQGIHQQANLTRLSHDAIKQRQDDADSVAKRKMGNNQWVDEAVPEVVNEDAVEESSHSEFGHLQDMGLPEIEAEVGLGGGPNGAMSHTNDLFGFGDRAKAGSGIGASFMGGPIEEDKRSQISSGVDFEAKSFTNVRPDIKF